MSKNRRTLWQAAISLWGKTTATPPPTIKQPDELSKFVRISGRMEFSDDIVWGVAGITTINRQINGSTMPIKVYDIASGMLPRELPDGHWRLWNLGPGYWTLTMRKKADSGATVPWDDAVSPGILDTLCDVEGVLHNGEDERPFHRDLKNIACDVECWTHYGEQSIVSKASLWTYYRRDYDEAGMVIDESLMVLLSGVYNEKTKTIDGGDMILTFDLGEPLADGSVMFY